jgi:predicted enzyme related to lactoylglutathione lyase
MAQGIQGRFVWQELTTEDPATAVAFYSKVVGWHAHPNPSHPSYTEFGIGSSHSAGMMPLTDDARAAGVRSNWQPYIGAADVDATVATAQQLGGKVVHAAQDIEHVGRFATLTDPQGGVFAVFKPSGPGSGAAPPAKPAVGSFAWLELATSDYEAAFAFYGKLFGWQVIQRMDMGPQGVYLIFGADGVQQGGMYKMHQDRSAKPYWLPYAEVASADAAATAATAAGGRILVGPMDVPGGRMVQVLDPSGAMFAVHSAAAPAKAAAPSKPSQPAAPKPATPKPAATPPAAPKPVAAKTPPAAAKPAASPTALPAAKTTAAKKKAAPKKAAAKKPVAKKKPAAKKAKKKVAAKKKPAARKKKAPARKSAAKSARKAVKKSAKKKVAAKKKSAKSKRPVTKARRKK